MLYKTDLKTFKRMNILFQKQQLKVEINAQIERWEQSTLQHSVSDNHAVYEIIKLRHKMFIKDLKQLLTLTKHIKEFDVLKTKKKAMKKKRDIKKTVKHQVEKKKKIKHTKAWFDNYELDHSKEYHDSTYKDDEGEDENYW